MRSYHLAAILTWLTVLSVATPAQHVVALTQSAVVLVDRAMQDIRIHAVPPATVHAATDGRNVAWATHGDAASLSRFDIQAGTVSTSPTLHDPKGVAMTGDGGVVVVEVDNLGGGWIERFDAAGNSLWSAPTDPGPKLVAVDRLGQIWVTHGLFVAKLTRHAPDGTLLSRLTLDPLPARLAASSRGYVWTLCTLTSQVYCYSESGDLAVKFAVPAGVFDFALDLDDNLVLLDTVDATLQLRGPFGGSPVDVPIEGDPSQIAFDAGGGLWSVSSTNGLMSIQQPPGAPAGVAGVGIGVGMSGDWSGLGFLSCVGRHLDSDDDGVPNGLEFEAHTDPLDPLDVPMALELLAPATAGAVVPFLVRSTVTPSGFYWLCASASRLDVGEGVYGLPLAQDALFDAFQSNWSTAVFTITAGLDNLGEDLNALFLPSSAVGASFWMAFLAMSPSDVVVIPSPATRIDVL